MRKFIILQIVVALLNLMVCGCGSKGHDSRLSDIALRVDTAPRTIDLSLTYRFKY